MIRNPGSVPSSSGHAIAFFPDDLTTFERGNFWVKEEIFMGAEAVLFRFGMKSRQNRREAGIFFLSGFRVFLRKNHF